MLSSFILKVKAAEIIPSGTSSCCFRFRENWNNCSCVDQYHMNFTLRFPRAVGIRDDLNTSDCMTATGKCGLLCLG
jgi:DNA ligase 4